MQEISIRELKPHPLNNYFFDDVEGDKWQEFLASVKSRGVIEPIIITTDMVVVSGHQRLRACEELNIETVKVEIRHYNNDNEVLQELLETNIRQRGTIGGSTIKLGRRIAELERLYGIKHGGDRTKKRIKSANGTLDSQRFTETELASRLGISFDTLKRAKKLSTLPIEIQDLVMEGKVSASTASRLIAKLPVKEQEQLAKALPATRKLTQKQVQEYINLLEEKDNEIQQLISQRQALENLAQIKQTELLKLEEKIKTKNKPSEKTIEQQLQEDVTFFCTRCDSFIKATGGLAYLADRIDMLPDCDQRMYKAAVENVLKSVQPIVAWAQNILVCMR